MKRISKSLGAALVLLLAGCGADSASPTDSNGSSPIEEQDITNDGEGLTNVRIGTSLVEVEPVISAWTVPQALGYWEDEGLDVEILGFPGGSAVLQAVDAGQILAGGSGSGPLIASGASNADLIAYFTTVTSNYYIPQVLPDSDIQEPADLKGATIGVSSLESAAVPMLVGILADAGISESDVDIVGVGTGAEAAEALSRGSVDAITLWDSAHQGVEKVLDLSLRPVITPKFESLGFQESIVVTQSTLTDERELLIKLARGLAKGHIFASENPEAAVKLHWSIYPETKPTGVSEEEALELAVSQLRARNENTQPAAGQDLWGYAPEDDIATNIAVISSADPNIDAKNVQPKDIYTDSLLKEVNDFDHESIRQQARDYVFD